MLVFGPLELDSANRCARIDGGAGAAATAIELGPREWTVLEYLLIRAPKPASRDKLLQALTGWDKEITPCAVEVYAVCAGAGLGPGLISALRTTLPSSMTSACFVCSRHWPILWSRPVSRRRAAVAVGAFHRRVSASQFRPAPAVVAAAGNAPAAAQYPADRSGGAGHLLVGGRAFKPLVELAITVEHRSPRDLNPIDEANSPAEVRPLVRALNHLFDMVRTQVDGQRRFVADAAHQLRTPLAGLQAQVEAWALLVRSGSKARKFDEKPAPALIHKAFTAITLGLEEIEKLRAAMRRTSQLGADTRNVDAAAIERVDLQKLCETALELHLDAAAAKGIDLGIEAAPMQASGHGWPLLELLSNLVDNAVKYSPLGGRVTIRCGWCALRGGWQPFIEVEDDGPGVPPAEHARVLQRFYRVPGTSGEGTGLGLSIADEIARAHGNALELGSGAGGRGLRVRQVFAAEAQASCAAPRPA